MLFSQAYCSSVVITLFAKFSPSSLIATATLDTEDFDTLVVAFVTDLLAETFSLAADFFSTGIDSSF